MIVILNLVFVVEDLMLGEECVVHDGNLNHRFQMNIGFFSISLIVDIPAAIDKDPVCPVLEILNLQLNDYDTLVVELNSEIQNGFLGINGSIVLDRIQ